MEASPDKSRKAKADRMVQRLCRQHALGKQILRAQHRGKSIADLSEKHPYSEHTLRKIRAFAEHFTDADLEMLCRGRRPNGLPLHWGYIPILLGIETKRSKKDRKRFQREAIKYGWSVAQLRRVVRQEIGFKGHGRTIGVPEDLEAGLQDLGESVDFLKRRCDVLMHAAQSKGNRRVYSITRNLASMLSRAVITLK